MAIPLGGKSKKSKRNSNHTWLNSEFEVNLKPDPVFKEKGGGRDNNNKKCW